VSIEILTQKELKIFNSAQPLRKDGILDALKNSSMVIYFFINMFGIYDFQSHSKKTHRLIALYETKGFMSATGLEK